MQPRELLILQPAATKPEELEELKEDRPFVVKGELPRGAEFVQLLSIPTIVDMVGFSSGGGPPGFAYLVSPMQGTVHTVWFLVGPNLPFVVPDRDDPELNGKFLGVVHVMGMLFGAVQMQGTESAIDRLLKGFEEADSMIFKMVPYKIPDMMRRRYFPHEGQRKPSV